MQAVLSASGLTRRFGALTAVDDLSLEVYSGEVFGFLGPNGAGKTTSINMLTGLLKPDAGQVLIQGRPVNSSDPQVRRRVGVCPQETILWGKLTCQEQLEFIAALYGVPRAEARRRAIRLLEELDLAEKRRALAGTLSGGMQRRLNIALALVHDPELVILDEPEAGLDPQSRLRVREYIQGLARKKTVILTTHNMDEAERLADRVAIIDHGRLLVLDTPSALKQRLGQGDVIEITLQGGDFHGKETTCRDALAGLSQDVTLLPAERRLRLRALHAVGQLPQILAAVEHLGYQPGEVAIRPNTLEDVFIQLTGRRLRE